MRPSVATFVRQPLQHQSRSARSVVRKPSRAQALFGFLTPTKPKTSPNKAKELVEELLQLTERTNGGLDASPSRRQQIAELVEELESFCPRSPLRSPLLFGDYEVLYASKPQTAGGPFRSPLGRTVFPGQRALQSLQEPNICINEVTYKTLGFIPGSARQEGEFFPIDSNTFQLIFSTDGKAKGGPPQRIIRIGYLDERIRVARFIPPEDGDDAEGSFYVFRRLVEDESEEVEEPQQERLARSSLAFGTRKIKAAVQENRDDGSSARRKMLGTQLLGRKDGLATMAEKRYAQQKSGSRGTGPGDRSGTGSTATAQKSREEIAAERAAARAAAEEERRAAREAANAERRAAQEAAAAAKAAVEKERRARQAQLEAERARVAELKQAARMQMTQVQSEASEAADEAKAAAVSAKNAEKEASGLLQQASQARSLIDQAASATALAVQQLDGLRKQEREAAAVVANARSALKQLGSTGWRR